MAARRPKRRAGNTAGWPAMLLALVHRAPSGHRCGESHPRARLSDGDIERIRALHDQHGLGYARLAGIYRLSVSGVRSIVLRRTRANAALHVRAAKPRKES